MTSDPTTIIDRTTIDASTGKLALIIQVNEPWDDSGVAHRLVREKVKNYVRHIRTRAFREKHGRDPNDTIIRVVSVEPPGDATVDFLERVRYELDKHGIDFDLEVDWTGESPSPENGRLEVRGWEVRPEGRGRKGVRPKPRPPSEREGQVEPEPGATGAEPADHGLASGTPRPETSEPGSVESDAVESNTVGSNTVESSLIEPEAIELDAGEDPSGVDPFDVEVVEPPDLGPLDLPMEIIEPEAPAEDTQGTGPNDDEVDEDEQEDADAAEGPEAGTARAVPGRTEPADEPIVWPAEEFGGTAPTDQIEEERTQGPPDRAVRAEIPIRSVERDVHDDDIWLELAGPQSARPERSNRTRAGPGAKRPGRDLDRARATATDRPSLKKALGAALRAGLAGSLIWAVLAAVSGNAASPLAIAVSLMVGFSVRIKGSGQGFAFRLVGGLGTLLACALGSVLSAGALVALTDGLGVAGLIQSMSGLHPLLDTLGRYFDASDLALYGAATLLGGLLSVRRED